MGFRYKLTEIGWIGAILFVVPTPLAAWHYNSATGDLAKQLRRREMYQSLDLDPGTFVAPEVNGLWLTALATATLIGLVLVIVGRETVPA